MGASFSLDISRFVDKTHLTMNDVVRGVMYSICEKAIMTTPVKTGRARRNWVMQMDGALEKRQTGALDPTGERSLDRIAFALESFEAGKTKVIWFTNTLPYIVMLEYGWSRQAPAGIVRMALLTFKHTVVHSIGAAR